MRRTSLHIALLCSSLIGCELGEELTATTDAVDTHDSEHADSEFEPEPTSCAGGPYALAYELQTLAPGVELRGVTLGDVDDDGRLDVIAAAYEHGELLVFRQGDAGLEPLPATSLPQSLSPEAMRGGAIADDTFDVVTRAHMDSAVLLRLRGDGNGGFLPPETLPILGHVFALAPVTDDATLDLLVPSVGKLHVYPGDAVERFTTHEALVQSTPWSGPGAITTDDFDDDGDIDVAAANLGALRVGLNTGAGVFEFADPLALPGSPSDLDSGDVDGDGRVELALTTYGGSDAAHLFRNLGGGQFADAQLLDAPDTPICLDLADLDDDGREDLAIIGADTLALYPTLGAAEGGAGGPIAFAEPLEVNCAGTQPRQIALGDLNGDCIVDAVSATASGVCVMMSRR